MRSTHRIGRFREDGENSPSMLQRVVGFFSQLEYTADPTAEDLLAYIPVPPVRSRSTNTKPMWYLQWQDFNQDEQVFYLWVNEEIKVGRGRDCHLSVSDESISRNHASIRVVPPVDGVGWDNADIILEDKKAKSGVTVNGQRAKNTKTVLKHGDKIQFGRQAFIFQLRVVPLVVLTSCLSGKERSDLVAQLAKFGGRVASEWSRDCTHLCMPGITVTAKAVCSLLKGIPLVTLQYFADVEKFIVGRVFTQDDYSKPPLLFPNAEDPKYMPPVQEEALKRTTADFHRDIRRSRLFAGKTFYFLYPKQQEKWTEILQLANAKTIVADEPNSVALKVFSGKNAFVILPTRTPDEQVSAEFRAWVTAVGEELKRNGRRFIPESEISMAIIFCSTERFCNPNDTSRVNNSGVIPESEPAASASKGSQQIDASPLAISSSQSSVSGDSSSQEAEANKRGRGRPPKRKDPPDDLPAAVVAEAEVHVERQPIKKEKLSPPEETAMDTTPPVSFSFTKPILGQSADSSRNSTTTRGTNPFGSAYAEAPTALVEPTPATIAPVGATASALSSAVGRGQSPGGGRSTRRSGAPEMSPLPPAKRAKRTAKKGEEERESGGQEKMDADRNGSDHAAGKAGISNGGIQAVKMEPPSQELEVENTTLDESKIAQETVLVVSLERLLRKTLPSVSVATTDAEGGVNFKAFRKAPGQLRSGPSFMIGLAQMTVYDPRKEGRASSNWIENDAPASHSQESTTTVKPESVAATNGHGVAAADEEDEDDFSFIHSGFDGPSTSKKRGGGAAKNARGAPGPRTSTQRKRGTMPAFDIDDDPDESFSIGEAGEEEEEKSSVGDRSFSSGVIPESPPPPSAPAPRAKRGRSGVGLESSPTPAKRGRPAKIEAPSLPSSGSGSSYGRGSGKQADRSMASSAGVRSSPRQRQSLSKTADRSAILDDGAFSQQSAYAKSTAGSRRSDF